MTLGFVVSSPDVASTISHSALPSAFSPDAEENRLVTVLLEPLLRLGDRELAGVEANRLQLGLAVAAQGCG